MQKSPFLFLALGVCWLSLHTANAASAESRSVSLPFTIHGGLIWVEVREEKQGEPLQFVFDTGAEVSVLDLSAARRLNVKLGGREAIQGVHGRMSAFHVRDFNATFDGRPLPESLLAFDLSSVSRSVGRRIDGLVGADFFRSAAVRIDYANRRISVGQSSFLLPAGGVVEKLPLRRRGGILCTEMTIDGVPSQWMRIDTGCSEPLHWSVDPGKSNRADRGKSIAVSSGRVVFSDTTVHLGNRKLTAVRTGFHGNRLFRDEDGLLGNGLLSKFDAVTLDTRSRKLFLE